MTSHRLRSILTSLAVSISVVTQSSLARAQSGAETSAAAEALFSRAKQLLDKKQYHEACLKLEESQRLDPAIGTLLYLGFCYEKVGRDASAWSTYRAAQSSASQAGQTGRAEIAQRRAERLEPRLARLVVNALPSAPATLKVTRNGVELGAASLGQSMPVDPGEHLIVAKAPGRQTFSTVAKVEPGKTTTVDIGELRAEEPAPQATKDDSPTPASGTREFATAPKSESEAQLPIRDEPLETRDRNPRQGGSSVQRWFGIGTSVVGIAGIAVGGAYALRSRSKSNAAEGYRRLGTNIYDEPGYSLNREALDARTIAITTSAAGAAALVGGVVLYLTAGSSRSKSAGVLTHAAVLVLPNAITVEGKWR